MEPMNALALLALAFPIALTAPEPLRMSTSGDDYLIAVQDRALDISRDDLLQNDIAPGGGSVDATAVISIDGAPAHGTLTPAGSAFLYQPSPSYFGTDTFS